MLPPIFCPRNNPTNSLSGNLLPLKSPLVCLPHTAAHELASSLVDQTYRVFVALPPSYAASGKTYPVLYSLDANGSFALIRDIVHALLLGPEIPELLVVGIGYPADSYVATQAVRNRDFTPTADEAPYQALRERRPAAPPYAGSGGAPNFLRFICEELMPFIARHYRVDPSDATLYGHSLGGLFALHTLFHATSAFQRYLVSSPSLWWDRRMLFEAEAQYAATHADLAARVFLSAGGLEEPPDSTFQMISNVKALVEQLRDRCYPSLALTSHVFDDETHLSVSPSAITRGLRTLYV
jgi:predicted alpha/beta superfamily hydrolase